jgi:signal transduction histidine kinase/ligand-binding sensor domain-containing protein
MIERRRNHQFPMARSSNKVFWSLLLAIAQALLLCNVAKAAPADTLTFKLFGIKDGLSSNTIHCMLQDANGFLWVGTDEGLNRFDGRDFVQFFHDPNNLAHSLSGNSVRDIAEFQDRLFISTDRGISVYNLRTLQFENGLISDPTYNYTSRQSINFMKRIDGLWYLGGEKLLVELNEDLSLKTDLKKLLPPEEQKTARDFLRPSINKLGQLYFVACGGLLFYDPKTGKHFGSSSIQQELNLSVTFACHTAPVFFSGDNKQLIYSKWSLNPSLEHRYDAKSPKWSIAINAVQPAFSGSTKDIFELNEAKLWMAGEYGLVEVDRQNYRVKPVNLTDRENAQPICRAIYRDRQNSIWVASSIGLFQCVPVVGNVTVMSVPQIAKEKRVVSAAQFVTHRGKNYFCLDEGDVNQLFELEGAEMKAINVPLSKGGIRSLCSINDTCLLIGSWKGLSAFHPEKGTGYDFDWMPIEHKDKAVIDMLYDTHQQLWLSFGMGNGILRYHFPSGSTTYFNPQETGSPKSNVLPIANAYDLAEDANGNVWMVRSKQDGKLIKWDAKKDEFQEITPKNIDPINTNFNGEAYCVVADGNIIWFAVVREGLFRFDPISNELKQYTRLDGLPSNNIYSMEMDASGRLWMGTSNGLACFDEVKNSFKNFPMLKDGSALEFNSASCYDRHNDRMFFSANGFVVSFNPSSLFQQTADPKLHLTSLKVEGQEAGVLPIDFKAGQNHFDFIFTAVDLLHANEFEYRYMLKGLDKEWVRSGLVRSASYANIPPGSYEFLVSVKANGEWSDGEILYSFALPKFFYETWWFRTLMAALLIAIFYLFYWLKTQRLKQLEMVRSRISRDLHDDIGSSLTSIRILSQRFGDSGAAETDAMKRIHTSSQKMLDDMDDIIWTINPQNDKGEHLLSRMREFAAELTEPKGIGLNCELDEDLEKLQFTIDQKRNIYLIFKEALNNAVKHAHAQNISIRFGHARSGNGVELTVVDDGIGYYTDDPKRGNGTINIKKRAEEIRSRLETSSELGKGTTITLRVPLK